MEFDEFKASLNVGLVFKKAKVNSEIIKIESDGIRYSIGENGNSKKVYFEEFKCAIEEINNKGFITRKWYNKTFPIQAKAASCNFTTIGGLLGYFSKVRYETGKFIKVN